MHALESRAVPEAAPTQRIYEWAPKASTSAPRVINRRGGRPTPKTSDGDVGAGSSGEKRLVFEAQCAGHRFMRELAVMHIKAARQTGIELQSPLPAVAGE
jgi:hypothetical protein